MRTLGVDVSSQDHGTAVCVARWTEGRCTLERLEVGARDDTIVTDRRGRASTRHASVELFDLSPNNSTLARNSDQPPAAIAGR